jgi:2,3-bisphosphoglycerate-dependent phosphoglycerate mutase
LTTIYFIRHAQADNSITDGRIRPLTAKGMKDRLLVTDFLSDKKIDAVFSSPFKRAVDTITDFAEKNKFSITTVNDFRERKSDTDMRKSNLAFNFFMEKQWEDFNYTFSDGECLLDVQKRNITALNKVLTRNNGMNIVIGTHGTALASIINYYDETFSFSDFMAMVDILPWVVEMRFDGLDCASIQKIDLFKGE